MCKTFKDRKDGGQVKARIAQELRARSRVRITDEMLRNMIRFTESIN